jgi:hypothetical protein
VPWNVWIPPTGARVTAVVQEFEQPPGGLPTGWVTVDTFDNFADPPDGEVDWGSRFQCEPIGDGSWSECWLRLDDSVCAWDAFVNMRRWQVRVLDDPQIPAAEGIYVLP